MRLLAGWPGREARFEPAGVLGLQMQAHRHVLALAIGTEAQFACLLMSGFDRLREDFFDLHAAQLWGDHPYGYSILGTRDTVTALRAQDLLLQRYGVAADVWSVTSYKTLRTRTLEAERWNMWHPEDPPQTSYLHKTAQAFDGPCVAVSDYVRLVSQQIAPWIPGGLLALGTDGFGRSDTRQALRRFFEIDAEHLAVATLYALHQQGGKVSAQTVRQAAHDLGVRGDDQAPWQR